VHAMADPHLRVELSTQGQYCGPTNSPTKSGTKKRGKKGRGTKKRKSESDDRDYFEEYCQSVFTDWDNCKKLATTLISTADNQLTANIEAYRNALCEDDLYDPFQYLANRAFELARQDDVSKQTSQCNGVNVTPNLLLNLLLVPTYNRPILGCADKRR
jgi:hypothetical protein